MGKLFLNIEFRIYMILLFLAGIAGSGICFYIDFKAGMAAVVMFLTMAAISFLFTKKRYTQMEELSDQLSKIISGDYNVNVEKYKEGELSILATNIFKITTTLSYQADSLKSDKTFLADSLADISHQLKTPLTSISILLDLLENPELPENKQKEFINGMRLGINRIEWLVKSLLKLSRLDAGKISFKFNSIYISDLVEEASASLLIPIELKNQKLVYNIEPEATCFGDAPWLLEAISNLLKNSMEQTPVGGTISVFGKQNSIYTQIDICDNGPGIMEKDITHIFERFYKGENSSPDSIGIGLALSKSIIQNMNGTIDVKNKEDGGVCFTIKLYGKFSGSSVYVTI